VTTGDPIYTKLTRGLQVSLRDTFSGEDLTAVQGTLRLHVSISAADGWTAPLGAGVTVPVQQGTATATVPLYPETAEELLARHYAEVGGGGTDANLVVTPAVAVTGTVGGHGFTAKPLAPLTLALGATTLRVAGADTVLTPLAVTPVSVEKTSPRRLAVLSLSVPIGAARWAAGIVFVLALATLAASAWVGRSRSDDPADTILLRNSARILPVSRFTPGTTVIDVSDGASLHRVAERLDSLVLHLEGPDGHTFAVQDVDATYRFVLPVEQGGRAVAPPPAVPGRRASRPRHAAGEGETTRLRPALLDDGTARINRVHRRIPVPPNRSQTSGRLRAPAVPPRRP
jgi:hypothetical protein